MTSHRSAPRLLAALLTLTAALVSAPAAVADEFYGVTPQAQLISFDAVASAFRTPVALSGLASGEAVAALDVRAATGGLYGIAQKGSVLRLVRIDQATGVVTPIGLPVTVSGTPTGIGMDFNPTTDRLVVGTTGGTYFSLDPDTGAVTTLPATNPATAQMAGIAYTLSSPSIPVAIDVVADTLVIGTGSGSFSPFVTPLGVNVVAAAGLDVGLDISADGTLWMAATTTQYRLFRISAFSGEADDLGPIGPLAAFCVRLTGPAAFGAPAFGVGEGDGAASVVIHRDSPSDGVARVAWTTVDGTATAGADYTAASGVVTFARDETAKTVTVPIAQDAAVEGTERFAVRLTSVDGVGTGPDAAVVIGDDDQPAVVTAPPPPPPPPAPPVVDITKPVVLGLPLTLKLTRSLKLPYAVSEAGTATLTLQLSAADAKKTKLKRLLATVKLKPRAGENRATVKLTAAAYKALRKRKKLAATAEIVALDAAGNAGKGAIKVTLRR